MIEALLLAHPRGVSESYEVRTAAAMSLGGCVVELDHFEFDDLVLSLVQASHLHV